MRDAIFDKYNDIFKIINVIVNKNIDFQVIDNMNFSDETCLNSFIDDVVCTININENQNVFIDFVFNDSQTLNN